MALRCNHCAHLSIEYLVELAEKEYEARGFPREAYYKHHESFKDLERSANDGCDLCELILGCFKGSDHDAMWPRTWNPPGQGDINNSMYAVAKDLDVSDVKIAIDSDQCYMSDKIDKVSAFDTLLIQVGAGDEIASSDEDEEADDKFPLPLLRLTLSTPRDKATSIRGYQIGRFQVDSNLGSDANFELARGWLKTCRTNHLKCIATELTGMPTRVIYVGVTGDAMEPRIINTRDLKAEYVALSHCWGGNINQLLTTKTLRSFQVALPYAELAANFRDAIVITRELGIRYLWIDSLCILQDSKEDWEKESRRMGEVYGDATLTISALAAKASYVGILKGNPPPQKLPAPTSLRVFLDDDRTEQVTVEREDPEQEYLNILCQEAPLSTRGWTLQEFTLSPRHIFFGGRQIYWKCPQGFDSADGICTRFKAPSLKYEAVPHVLNVRLSNYGTEEKADKPAVLNAYYEMVEDYSHRRLTFESDKFPAFSGLARRLQAAIGDVYLAGLWSSDPERGLLWESDAAYARHVKTYRAPSWSWAVTDDPVLFPSPLAPNSLKMKLLSHNILPTNISDPFGQIRSGHLVVEGFATPVIRSAQMTNIRRDLSIGHVLFDESEGDIMPGHNGWADLFRITVESSTQLVALRNSYGTDKEPYIDPDKFSELQYTIFLVHVDETTGEALAPATAKCLVLRQLPAQPRDTCERVGRATIDGPRLEWLRSWESRVFTLV